MLGVYTSPHPGSVSTGKLWLHGFSREPHFRQKLVKALKDHAKGSLTASSFEQSHCSSASPTRAARCRKARLSTAGGQAEPGQVLLQGAGPPSRRRAQGPWLCYRRAPRLSARRCPLPSRHLLLTQGERSVADMMVASISTIPTRRSGFQPFATVSNRASRGTRALGRAKANGDVHWQALEAARVDSHRSCEVSDCNKRVTADLWQMVGVVTDADWWGVNR